MHWTAGFRFGCILSVTGPPPVMRDVRQKMESPPQFLSQAVERETSNSKILWSARPDPWGYARSRWKHALIGIPFTAFAVFWTWGASGGFSGSIGKSPPP